MRFIGIHESLRARALSVRDEWAYYDDWVREQPRPMPLTSEERAIKQRIEEGQNPNQPQHLRANFLDAGEYDLRPLEAAILARHAELVRLLLRVGGASFDRTRALCFARLRLPEVLSDLGAAASDSPEPIEIAAAFRMCEAY